MRKLEIGGYFGLDDLVRHEYHEGLIALNSARNALVYLLKARAIRKLYIPDYLCDTVARVCEREGYAYEYYAVGPDFLPLFDKELGDREYLYVVNYFGQIANDTLMALKRRYGAIIVDNVQAFFQRPLPGTDTIYSCRKFFGVPDGGYLATDARLAEELPEDLSGDRMRHILGRFEGSASDYYGVYAENEESFYGLELRKMSRLTHNLLGAIDYEAVRSRRESNFRYLHDALGDRNRLTPICPAGPFAYPFLCPDGPRVRKALIARKIYVPTLWPEAIRFGGTAADYSMNILPLPVDQRYTDEDMQVIKEELLQCMRI